MDQFRHSVLLEKRCNHLQAKTNKEKIFRKDFFGAMEAKTYSGNPGEFEILNATPHGIIFVKPIDFEWSGPLNLRPVTNPTRLI